MFGSVDLKILDIFKIVINKILTQEFFTPTWSKNIEIIIWNLRLPRILIGVVAGAGLSLAGILMQTLTKNSLADPYILGISSGASTGAVLMIFFSSHFLLIPIGAFLLGILTSLFVFYNSERGKASISKLILNGVAVSTFLSGITTFLIMTSPNERQIRSAMFWMTGSLASGNWQMFQILLGVLIISYLVIRFFYQELNILLTGDESAQLLGVDVKFLKKIIIIVSSLLVGTIVANTGIIGFVGLMIPHIGRILVGADHKKLIKFSLLSGGIFLVFADFLARNIFRGQEIPIGVITALLGAPFFLWLVKNEYKLGGK
jgi:iron complex transport system permease protein